MARSLGRPQEFFGTARSEAEKWFKSLAWLNTAEGKVDLQFPLLCDYAQWIVDTAQSIGMTYGEHSLPNSEIAAWVQLTNVNLTVWEIETMKHLSAVYISALREYSDKSKPPPYESTEQKNKRAIAADQAARDSW